MKRILPILITFFISNISLAQNVYVDGNVTTTGSGSKVSPYKTISEAVLYANSNAVDTIHIAATTYSGGPNRNLDLSKSDVVVYGEDPSTTIINLGTDGNFITTNKSEVKIENLWINGINSSPSAFGSNDAALDIKEDNLLSDSTYVYINNCFFSNNQNTAGFGSVDNGGGAIHISPSTGNGVVLTVDNSQFINSFAFGLAKGGGVYVGSNNHLNFMNSESFCADNSAITDIKGGFFAFENASANIYNSQITGSAAGKDGGALWANSTSSKSIKIIDSYFTNNVSSDGYGGAIAVENNINLIIDNVEFATNTTKTGFSRGGIIYLKESTSNVTVDNSVFVDNTWNHSSGYSVFVNYGSSALTISNSGFYNNRQNVIERNNRFTNGGGNDLVSVIIPTVLNTDCSILPPTCTNTTPTANATQTFCAVDNATVADLTVTSGASLVWYDTDISTTPLLSTEVLVDGEDYWVSDETTGCDPSARFQVTVVISNPLTPTIVDATQEFCVNGTVADLSPSAYWYVSDGSGNKTGNVLNPTDVLINGETYVAVDSAGICESTVSSEVTVVISNPLTPTIVDATQEFCVNGTVADLSPSAYWYVSDGSGNKTGNVLNPTDALINGGTYVAVDSSGICESAVSSEVTVVISNPLTPTIVDATQEFCVNGTVGDLSPSAYWYLSDGSGNKTGNVLDPTDALINGETYVAVDSAGICESAVSSEVTVIISNPLTPTIVDATQEFCVNGTVADLSPSVYWYVSDGSGNKTGNVLEPTDALINGVTYVAVDSAGICESAVSSEVTVVISNPLSPTIVDATQEFCVNGTVADLSPSAYWYVSDGSGNKTGNVLDATDALINGGTYVAVDSAGICESAVSSEVTVREFTSPTATMSTVDNGFCAGGNQDEATIEVELTGTPNFTFTFRKPDGTDSIIADVDYSPYVLNTVIPGDYELVSVEDANGCANGIVSGGVQTIIEDALPEAAFIISNSDGSSGTPCDGTLVDGDVVNPDELNNTYTWSTGTSGITVTDVADNELTLTVEDIATSCVSTNTQIITRFVANTLTIQTTDFCEDSSSLVSIVYAAGQDVNTFPTRVWEDGLGNNISELNPGEVEILTTTNDIQLTATDINGCNVLSNIVDVTEILYPVSDIDYYLTTGEEYKGYTIDAITNADGVYWAISESDKFDYDTIYSDLTLYNQFPLTETDYILNSINFGNGISCKTLDTLPGLIINPNYEIPNVVTPNGDDVNDYFYVKNAEFTQNIDIKLFNRWGSVLFETDSKLRSDGWNGTNQSGDDVSEGVYVYMIQITEFNGTISTYNGTVQLIRN